MHSLDSGLTISVKMTFFWLKMTVFKAKYGDLTPFTKEMQSKYRDVSDSAKKALSFEYRDV